MPMLKTIGAASLRPYGFMSGGVAELEIGNPYAGGYFMGVIKDNGVLYNLIISPKALGSSSKNSAAMPLTVEISSLTNGFANTEALANSTEVIHGAARWARSLNINGYTDWYIPARDEMEMMYRYFKATTTATVAGARVKQGNDTILLMGSNVNSVPIGEPYTSTYPVQTPLTAFKSPNGSEHIYANPSNVTSTRYQASTTTMCSQNFTTGAQSGAGPSNQLYRVIRRELRPAEK